MFRQFSSVKCVSLIRPKKIVTFPLNLISTIRQWQKIMEIVFSSTIFYNNTYNKNNKPKKSSKISHLWQTIMEMFEDFARTPSSEQSCFLCFSLFFDLSFHDVCASVENGSGLSHLRLTPPLSFVSFISFLFLFFLSVFFFLFLFPSSMFHCQHQYPTLSF